MPSGRVKGSLNKHTASLKEAILKALQMAGGIEYLYKVSRTDPKTFCGLLGRVLPLAVTGEDGGPIQVSVVRFSQEIPVITNDRDDKLLIDVSKDVVKFSEDKDGKH